MQVYRLRRVIHMKYDGEMLGLNQLEQVINCLTLTTALLSNRTSPASVQYCSGRVVLCCKPTRRYRHL